MSVDKTGISRGDEELGPCVPAKSRVRDRIFETACELFYQHGIHGVGVDEIAAEAGSNKMSFYRSFASKMRWSPEYLRHRRFPPPHCRAHSRGRMVWRSPTALQQGYDLARGSSGYRATTASHQANTPALVGEDIR